MKKCNRDVGMAILTALGMCARAKRQVIFQKIQALISRAHVPIAVNLCHDDAMDAFFFNIIYFFIC